MFFPSSFHLIYVILHTDRQTDRQTDRRESERERERERIFFHVYITYSELCNEGQPILINTDARNILVREIIPMDY